MYNTDNTSKLLEKFKDLIIQHNEETNSNIPYEFNLDLSQQQQLAFQEFKNGKNLLIIGKAGTGKSELIKEMLKFVKNQEPHKNMYITSTTGISAYNIGGITINSFLSIGTGEAPIDTLLKKIRIKKPIRERLINAHIIVIDEISMMSAELFEKINTILQTLRKNKKPFGGIQVILTGDFLQLKSIFKSNESINSTPDTRILIESPVFNTIFSNSIINLSQNFRQKDPLYNDILTRLRKNIHTPDDINTLATKLLPSHKLPHDLIHLVSSNKKAQYINTINLEKLPDNDVYFEASYTTKGNATTIDILLKELQNQFKQKGIDTIRLRKNCRVILIKNLEISNGLVNGSVGTVQEIFQGHNGIQGGVKIKFDNGTTQTITPVDWELELDNSKVTCSQLPLMLAYSITIHRSQSLSLDSAILDLADCFCDHQVYVALSRIRTLDGLYLKSFNPRKITVDSKLLTFVNSIEK
jgi:ATP-dependent DNA helicase PIF1